MILWLFKGNHCPPPPPNPPLTSDTQTKSLAPGHFQPSFARQPGPSAILLCCGSVLGGWGASKAKTAASLTSFVGWFLLFMLSPEVSYVLRVSQPPVTTLRKGVSGICR